MSSPEAKLFVSGFPAEMIERQIREMFEQFGEVIEVVLLRMKGTNNTRSCFIRFPSHAIGDAAMSGLNGRCFPGQAEKLNVKYSKHSGTDKAAPPLGAVPYRGGGGGGGDQYRARDRPREPERDQRSGYNDRDRDRDRYDYRDVREYRDRDYRDFRDYRDVRDRDYDRRDRPRSYDRGFDRSYDRGFDRSDDRDRDRDRGTRLPPPLQQPHHQQQQQSSSYQPQPPAHSGYQQQRQQHQPQQQQHQPQQQPTLTAPSAASLATVAPVAAPTPTPAPAAAPVQPFHQRMLAFEVKQDAQSRIDVVVVDKVLATCGQPVKITIQRDAGGGCSGFALMENDDQATRVVQTLSGREIFANDCFITFAPSDRQDLEVHYNNTQSWDYTQTLPGAAAPILGELGAGAGADGGAVGRGSRSPQRRGSSPGSERGGGRDWDRDAGRRGGSSRRREDSRDRRRPPSRERGARDRDGDRGGAGDRRREEQQPPRNRSPCVLVTGLNDEADAVTGIPCFTLDTMQQIFGVYGDVQRVKFLEGNSGRQALVQYRFWEEAEAATEKLDGLPIYGARLQVHRSQKKEIVPAEDDLWYKDFSELNLGRFGKTPVGKVFSARAPSNVLFVSGCNPAMKDEDLHAIFKGDNAVVSEMFRNKKTEGRVCFQTLGEAYAALVRTHGMKEAAGIEMQQPLRVAFSNKTIGDLRLDVIPKRR